MKPALVTLLALTLLAAAPACAQDRRHPFTPEQPRLVQPGHREWTWDGGDKLAIEAPVILQYRPSGTPRVVVTGPDALISHIQIGRGRVRVDNDWRLPGDNQITVTVTGVTVHDIALAGSGRADLNELNLDHLRLSMAGSGTVKANGRADQIDLSVSGSGKADLSAVGVRDANILVAGSGDVRISPRDSADVSIVGSGNVRMAVKPARLHQTTTGSGRISFSDGK